MAGIVTRFQVSVVWQSVHGIASGPCGDSCAQRAHGQRTRKRKALDKNRDLMFVSEEPSITWIGDPPE